MTKTTTTRFHSLRWMMLSLVSLLAGSFASAQQITCNQPGVQVSVDQNCEVQLTPDEIIEGSIDNGPYTLMLKVGNRIVESASGLDPITGFLLIDGDAISGPDYIYVNRTLRAEVMDRNGNICWTNITFEDKLAPELTGETEYNVTCAAPSVAATAPTVTDACTSAQWRLVSETGPTTDLCDGQTIVRSYIGFDENGNETEDPFVVTINITQELFDQTGFPADVEWTCEQYAANSAITEPGTASNRSGAPSVYRSNGGEYCKYLVTYEDEELPICNGADGVFKLLRNWRVLNWCDNSVLLDQQIIKVTDQINPTISIPTTLELTANTSRQGAHGVCGSSGLLPVPVLADNCSGAVMSTVTVLTPAGEATPLVLGGQLVGYQIPAPYLDLTQPGESYTVTYSVLDNCGNLGTASMEVTVADNTPPVAVCDEITNLSLTFTDATAVIANRLDDGSYDNCGDVYFKVIRMDELNNDPRPGIGRATGLSCGSPNSNGGPGELAPVTAFDDEAFFCCDDIATNNNMVVVRVFDVDPGDGHVSAARMNPGGDLFGRYNDCMVEVEVEDKLAPVKLLDAPDRIFSCTEVGLRQQYADQANFMFDAPTFRDNCEETTELVGFSNTVSSCGDGVITRRYQSVDAQGNRSQICTQTITFELEHDYTIVWPSDENENMCTTGVAGDTLSRPNGLIEDACDLLSVSYIDQRFSTNDEACYKILRTYDVINWCEWDETALPIQIDNPTGELGPTLDVNVSRGGAANVRVSLRGRTLSTSSTSVGRWSYIQTIKVYDEVAPVLGDVSQEACSAANMSVVDGECRQAVTVNFELTDNCNGLELPTFRLVAFTGDENNDGSISQAELANGVSLPSSAFGGRLRDNGAGQYTITGSYPLGSHVFVISANDYCGNAAEFYLPFTSEDCKPPTPKAFTDITIDLMATGMVNCTPAHIDNGSYDDCGPIKLAFSANLADTVITFDCDNVGLANPVQLWVYDGTNWDFVDVIVRIQNNTSPNACDDGRSGRIAASITTDGGMGVEGAGVNVSGDATMAGTTDVNGLTGFDVNNGGDYTVSALLDSDPTNGVTTYDLYLIGQHILGVSNLSTFSQLTAADANANGSVSAFDMTVIRRVILGLDQNFIDNTSWRFFNANNTASEVVNFNDVQSQVAADFLAVKVGDVNGTAEANSRQALAPRTLVGEFALVANDAVLAAGETQVVSFNASEVALGYQLTLEWDANALEVVGVNGGAHNAADFGKHLLAEGKLTMSHNGSMEGELFSLEVRALRDGVALSEVMTAGSSVTTAEAYSTEGAKSVAVRFGGAVAGAGNALEQNRPNPFAGTTQIGFTLAEAGAATLTVTDVTGRVVWRTAGQFDAGRSQVEIAAGELPSAGLLNYTLIAGDFTATRKMVVIK